MHIENRHPPPEGFFTNIVIRNWPCSSSPPSPEQFEVPQPVIPRSTLQKILIVQNQLLWRAFKKILEDELKTLN
jgi:hypothetical protein